MDVTYCVRLHTLVHVVAQSMEPVDRLYGQQCRELLRQFVPPSPRQDEQEDWELNFGVPFASTL